MDFQIENGVLKKYTGNGGNVVIPDGVTAIGNEVFYECKKLTSIIIPDSVTSIGGSAFRECSSLTSITIPDGVTTIGSWAFWNCSSLTSITIPDSVTSIGDSAFCKCSSLTSITLPDGVAAIGKSVFSGCERLTNITIPDSVTTIGDDAFYGCSRLTNITIPESVTSIGDSAFYWCRSLTSVTISNSVTAIGKEAFQHCISLTSITIPDSVTSIGNEAFYECKKLKSVTLPDSAITIGNDAFRGCEGLADANGFVIVRDVLYNYYGNGGNIVIPDSVTAIGVAAFYKCSNLTSITIPDSVTTVGYKAFWGCSSLTNITIPDSVTAIGHSAFRGCSSLTSITIPDSVTTIGDSAFSWCSSLTSISSYAFCGCSSLTSITIPESVTSIGNSAFSGCSSLTSMTIPDSVTSIGGSAFSDCTGLASVTIPDGVTSIGIYTFSGCSSLTNIAIPAGVTNIGTYAFSGCSGLTSITIPKAVAKISSYSFADCSSLAKAVICGYATACDAESFLNCNALTDVDYYGSADTWTSRGFAAALPNAVVNYRFDGIGKCGTNLTWTVDGNTLTISGAGNMWGYSSSSMPWYSLKDEITTVNIEAGVTSIGEYAFYGCSSLTSVTIPDSVTSIGNSAFYGCSGLTSVTIPDGVVSIGDSAFYGCSGLTSVTISDGVVSIGNSAFSGCSGLTSVTISDGVVSIGNSAFSGCSNLTSATIPDSVTSIGDYAFYGCRGLTDIIIPDSITSVGNYAFEYCSNLKNVHYFGSKAEWESSGLAAALPNVNVHYLPFVSGTCGEELTWSMIKDGVLTISGTGKMEDYTCDAAPWYSMKETVTSVIFETGVTSIGDCAFYQCSNLTSITALDSLQDIGDSAFSGCSSLISITIPDSVASVSDSSFSGCTSLAEVNYYGTRSEWDSSGLAAALPQVNVHYMPIISGTCGEELTWSMIKDGVLTISGTGAMTDYSFGTSPWYSVKDAVTSVIIENGATSIGNYSFCGCGNLASVTIPDGITSIGTSAFSGCSTLVGVEIPDSTSNIGSSAFYGCIGLTDITIPAQTVSIGSSAFAGCSGLTAATISDGVASIGASAFKECRSLTDITIPDSVTSIGVSAFSGCTGLAHITVSSSVTSIGSSAFYGCTALTAITIPSGVKTIGGYTFKNCTSLSSVTIADSVTSIGSYAFSGCVALKNITVPSGVENIGNYAFTDCTGLRSISLPDSVSAIGKYAFSNCSALTSVTISPSMTNIGEYTFYNCTGLTSVTISDSVTHIEQAAFSGCNSLTNVYFDGLSWEWKRITIEEDNDPLASAQKHYTRQESGTCGDNLEWSISENGTLTISGRGVMSDYTISSTQAPWYVSRNYIISVVIANGVTSIGNYAFYGCSNLMRVSIPKGVTSIGYMAFRECCSLVAVEIPDSVTKIGHGAFAYCESLPSITIPGSVQYIRTASFYNCSSLENVVIMDGVTQIFGQAFENCSSLKKIALPSSITTIYEKAFSGCSSLTSVFYGGSTSEWVKLLKTSNSVELSGAKVYCNVTSDPIPTPAPTVTPTPGQSNLTATLSDDGVLTISGNGAMPDYSSYNSVPWYNLRDKITSVVIEPGITHIGRYAFHNCTNLMSITIPNSVTSIGDSSTSEGSSFYNCTSLKNVYITDLAAWCGISFSDGYSNPLYYAHNLYVNGELVTELVIPDGVTSIGCDAFSGCSNLTSVTIPSSVKSIGGDAFSGCNGLTCVYILDLTAWCGIFFSYGCSNPLACAHNLYVNGELVTELVIPDGVTYIGSNAFSGCSNLTSITIPDSVTSIGRSPFSYCGNLTNVTFPSSVTSIADYAFSSCSSLQALTLYADLSSCSSRAFSYCSNLTEVNYYYGTEKKWISSGLAAALPNVSVRHLPTGSGEFGENLSWSFYAGVLTISGTGNIPNYAGAGETPWNELHSSVVELVIQDGITRVGNYAFSDCSKLETVSLPSSLTSIGSHAFASCGNLVSINLPTAIQTMESDAFQNCAKLQLFDLSSIPDTIRSEQTALDLSFLSSYTDIIGDNADISFSLSDAGNGQNVSTIAAVVHSSEGIYIQAYGTGDVLLTCIDNYSGARASKVIRIATDNYIYPSNASNTVASYGFLAEENSVTFSLKNVQTKKTVMANWSLAEGDEAYASINGKGVVTAKSVDCAHIITVIASPKSGGEYSTYTLKILPKAANVEISLNGTAVSGAMTQDMFKRSTLSFAAQTYPADASNAVKWTSSAASVAAVYENGTVTLLKPGKAVIKAAAQDGSGKTAQVTLTVVYIDSSSKLTLAAAEAVPKIGLQPGQSVQLKLSGANEIGAENVTFTIPAKQSGIGSIDENGVFTAGSTSGTVTVTATIKGDPLNRKATVSIKVIALQAQALSLVSDLPGEQITAFDGEPMAIFDKADLTQSTSFTLTPQATDYNGNTFNNVKLKWVSKDTSIATVSSAGVVTIKKGASGTVAIEATAQDLNKTVGRFWVQVRDYSPRLAATTVKLNSVLEAGASVGLVESYGNTITGVALSDARFAADYENGALTIKNTESISNGTYKMTLTVTCSNGRTYDYAITVKTVKTFPTVTMKQTAKFNLFYTNSTAALTVTTGQTIESVSLLNCDFVLTTDESGAYTIAYADPANVPAKPNAKGTLSIQLAGYTEPVTKALTVSTVTTAPTFKLSATASTVNTALNTDHSTAVQLLDKKTAAVQSLEDVNVWTDTANASAEKSGDTIILAPTAGKTVTVNVYMQGSTWTKSVKLTHKITVATKLPTLKAASTTLKLSNIFTEQTAETALVLSQANLTLSGAEITPVAKAGTSARTESDKLTVAFDGEKNLMASITDPANAPKVGTYSFTVKGTLEDGTVISGGTVKVTVAATAPTVKLSASSAKLNRYLAGAETSAVKVTMTNGTGYTVTGFEGMADGMSYEDGILTVLLPDSSVAGGSYKLYPIVRQESTGQEVALTKALTFKVTAYTSEKLTASLSTSGKLDTMNPDSAIRYTVTKIGSCLNTADAVTLTGADADKFSAELDTSGTKPVIKLTMVPGQEYATNVTYKVQFILSACGKDVLSSVMSVRVSQSSLKLKATTPITLYQSQTRALQTTITLTSPTTAGIADVQLNTTKTAALFLTAIGGERGFSCEIDGGTAKIFFTPTAAEKLKAGSSYKVVLDIILTNAAANAKPTQVTITVKVLK